MSSFDQSDGGIPHKNQMNVKLNVLVDHQEELSEKAVDMSTLMGLFFLYG